MRQTRGRVVEIETLADLDRRLAAGASSMSGWQLLALDLTGHREALRSCRVDGALFLGCRFGNGDEESVRARGAVVFPDLPGAPVESWRSALYSPVELYDTPRYEDSLDARAYAWSTLPKDRDASLSVALHDHAIDHALEGWIGTRRLVGVMGGHSLGRGSEAYADAARLGRTLARKGLVVATGGGPGAMEAANLGAWLSGESLSELDEALSILARVPSYQGGIGPWVDAAFTVLGRWPRGGESLGIPTWHYGHEPPNPFATAIAKYFRNAQREAILLEVCDAGIVFLPGAAGTVQEIFQDACENYYADESSMAPMVLVGVDHWTHDLPAWPLLQRLAAGRPMAGLVHLVDSLDEAAEIVARAPVLTRRARA